MLIYVEIGKIAAFAIGNRHLLAIVIITCQIMDLRMALIASLGVSEMDVGSR